MEPPVIDIHPHIIAPDPVRYPEDPIGGTRSTWSTERPASFEQLVEQMDMSGVKKAAIVQSSTVYGFDNSYVADSIAQVTDRFAGVFSVDVRAPNVRATIDYWLSKPGMVGLRIFTTGSTLPGQAYPIDDPATYKAWDQASEVGIPVCVQITPGAISELKQLLTRFPSAVVILDHFAKPDLHDGPPYEAARELFTLADYPNLYLKLTPRILQAARKGRATPQSFFEEVVERFGADHIAWGSNYPNDVGTLAELLQDARSALSTISDDKQVWIFGKTAERIYPSLAD